MGNRGRAISFRRRCDVVILITTPEGRGSLRLARSSKDSLICQGEVGLLVRMSCFWPCGPVITAESARAFFERRLSFKLQTMMTARMPTAPESERSRSANSLDDGEPQRGVGTMDIRSACAAAGVSRWGIVGAKPLVMTPFVTPAGTLAGRGREVMN